MVAIGSMQSKMLTISSSRVGRRPSSRGGLWKTPRSSTRVAAASFEPRDGNGQGNGPLTQPLAVETQMLTSVLTPTPVPDPVDPRDSKKLELGLAISGTNRGTLATLPRHRKIWRLLDELEAMNPTEEALRGSPAPLDGAWELLYSSAESFRSSPFFWAFQEGLVQDRDMAGAIFRFTDSIPGADIGRAMQRIDSRAGSLVSEVDMTVFPGISGVIVTTSDISGKGLTVDVTVRNTRVDNSLFSPVLDSVVVPVQELIERVRGAGSTRTTVEVLYLDDTLRVMRTPDDHYFVYGRPA